MSEAQKIANQDAGRKQMAGERLREYNKTLKGKSKPEAQRKKMSEARKGIKHSEETKQKLRGRAVSEETRKKLSDAQKGKPQPWNSYKRSEEVCQQMSEARKGKPVPWLVGRKRTPEEIQKQSELLRGKLGKESRKAKKIAQFDLSGNLIAEFYGAEEASRITGFGRSNIKNCLRGYSNTAGGYKWRYADADEA